MDKRSRAMFINSLSGFKSANLIATINKQQQTNVAMFSSVVHLGASPALVGFIMRPETSPNHDSKITQRHTLNNIIETESYTINQVSAHFWQQAHQTSARYNEDDSEFNHVGLTPYYLDGTPAPFVQESQLKYSLKLVDIMPIKHNNTQMVIGEITRVLCLKNAIKSDGFIDIESLNTVCVSGLDSYHETTHLSRLSYAKTDRQVTPIGINGKAK